MQKVENPQTKAQVINLLENADMKVSVDYVAKALNLSWNTARALLFSMIIEGEIEGEKTSKSWIFWVQKGINKP